jgi:hypothetical protein
MTARTLVAALLTLAALVHVPGRDASAQPPELQGTYALDRAASDNIDEVIEHVVKDMNFVRKPLARKRLKATTLPSEHLQISYAGADVTIVTDGGSSVRTPADGKPVEWTRDDGEKVLVTTTHEARTLTRVFRAEDGQRSNAYTVSPDRSTLTMSIVLTSPQLPEPVAYKLVYKRR